MNDNAWEVSIARCGDYEHDTVKQALITALAPIGGLDWVRPGMKIAVKANLLMPAKAEKAATVHPQVAVALCELLIEKGASVVLGDSPGGPFSAGYLNTVYTTAGMKEILKTGATLNGDMTYRNVSCPEAAIAKELQITSYLLEADAIIDLCKIKTHGFMAYTGACKNLFGAIPGTRKSEYHFLYQAREKFADMLVDICELLKPRISIADAVIAMEGNGPSGGTPRFMGAILCSFNPHALDIAAAHLMTMGMDDVPTLRAAHKRGLIPSDVSSIHVHGDLESFVIPDFKLVPKYDAHRSDSSLGSKLFRGMFASRPAIDTAACVGCAECANVCPAKAITLSNRRAQIQKSKCVRCFCCQEFCPKGIITVQRPYVARMLDRQGRK